MPANILKLFLGIVFVLVIHQAANADQPVALLIGNARYQGHPLKNPIADVHALGKTLDQLGFRSTIKEDLDLKGMREAVASFARETPTGSTALFYFSGYAAVGQYKYQGKASDVNFLQPFGPVAGKSSDIRKTCLALAEVVKTLEQKSGSRRNIIIIDACRQNPLTPKDYKRPAGLVEVTDAGSDTVVLLAAAPGQLEAPSRGTGSVLAQALRQHLPQGKTDLVAALQATASSVASSTGGKQNPSLNNPLTAPVTLPTTSSVPTPKDLVGAAPGQELVNSIGQVFCWCPAGKFTMGSPVDETDRSYDEDAVEVAISEGFWMAKFETTEREYEAVTRRKSRKPMHKNAPLTYATSGDAKRFYETLTKSERDAGRLPAGWKYALPTEAQWEYACRAGTTTPYHFGSDAKSLAAYGNFADSKLLAVDDSLYRYADATANDGHGQVALVGSYKPNAWNLYDMHGNVWEWCDDHYAQQRSGGKDPRGPKKGDDRGRVVRGGGWTSYAHYCRSAFRQWMPEINFPNQAHVGFRVVLKRSK